MSPERFTGVCTSGAPDGTPFPSNHSYGYALRSKGAPSNTPDAHPSGIFMQFPALARMFHGNAEFWGNIRVIPHKTTIYIISSIIMSIFYDFPVTE